MDTLKVKLQEELGHPWCVRQTECVVVLWEFQEFEVRGSETIESFTAKVREQEGLPPGDPRLVFGLYLEIKQTVLNVVKLDGTCDRVKVGLQAKIRHVKKILKRLTGIPRDEQQLMFGAVVLEDEKLLRDYDIRDESILTFIQLPRRLRP